MKVLVIGAGGREHALCWALRKSRTVSKLRCAPGNAGIARDAELVAIPPGAVDGLVEHAAEERYDLVVIGPEVPLVEGLADRLAQRGISAFGPSRAAARLEGSKAFSKEFMARHGIPTAAFRVFDAAGEAVAWLRSSEARYPLVVKADGLAAGKGVVLCDGAEVAVGAVRTMMVERAFGDAGARIVIEEHLSGREASFFVLCDGRRFVDLAPCQDYKRAMDGDVGPNTGGMGTYSPSAYLDGAIRDAVLRDAVAPTIDGLAAEGTPYCGVLFVGLMLTADGPKVLEYNCRFGDPEAQVLLPRLQGDWAEVLAACASGNLRGVKLSWRADAAVCVVLASGGYPGEYTRGHEIAGLDDAERVEGTVVFHAGTARGADGRLRTAGGRVLGVTALGSDLRAARDRAYSAASRIRWSGMHHRTDIALDAIGRTS